MPIWRRGRDSNPRYPYEYSAFRVRCDRPLCHLSARVPTLCSGGERGWQAGRCDHGGSGDLEDGGKKVAPAGVGGGGSRRALCDRVGCSVAMKTRSFGVGSAKFRSVWRLFPGLLSCRVDRPIATRDRTSCRDRNQTHNVKMPAPFPRLSGNRGEDPASPAGPLHSPGRRSNRRRRPLPGRAASCR